MLYPQVRQPHNEGFAVQGLRSIGSTVEVVYLSNLPERSASSGKMGDYGYALQKEYALVFPTEEKARWHAMRWNFSRNPKDRYVIFEVEIT